MKKMNIDVECGIMNLIDCFVVVVVIIGVRLNCDGIVIRLIDILFIMF